MITVFLPIREKSWGFVYVCVCLLLWIVLLHKTKWRSLPYKKKSYQSWLPPWDPADPGTHSQSFHKPSLCFKAQSWLYLKMASFKKGTMGLCVSCLPWLWYDLCIWSSKGKWSSTSSRDQQSFCVRGVNMGTSLFNLQPSLTMLQHVGWSWHPFMALILFIDMGYLYSRKACVLGTELF